jgi:hypothetical protein
MTYPFKLLVYDQHDGREEDGWVKFTYGFDLSKRQITDWMTTVLFDNDNNPIPCVQIFFTNDEFVYGRYSWDAFLKLYNGEYAEALRDYIVAQKILNGEIDQPQPSALKRLKRWWCGDPVGE